MAFYPKILWVFDGATSNKVIIREVPHPPRVFPQLKPASHRGATGRRRSSRWCLLTLLRDLHEIAGRPRSFRVVYANRKVSKFPISSGVKIGADGVGDEKAPASIANSSSKTQNRPMESVEAASSVQESPRAKATTGPCQGLFGSDARLASPARGKALLTIWASAICVALCMASRLALRN